MRTLGKTLLVLALSFSCSLIVFGARPKEKSMTQNRFKKPATEELRKRLSPLQYEVTQNEATERAFQNEYWNEKREGLYVDIVSGEPLFSSKDKYDSGCGWPSFTQPLQGIRLTEKTDRKLWQPRTEVRSPIADSHLGHVFNDGPGPTHLRYCINSAALEFIAVDQLEKRGYGEYLPLFGKAVPSGPALAPKKEVAILAGGCFWGMEEIIRQIPGVLETEVGYTGGASENATYAEVKKGTTGHAEAIRIVFDPAKVSFESLLGWFFKMHDPTTLNRQGNDIGTQYRSAIFVSGDEQKKTAEAVKKAVDASGKWKKPLVTEIVPAGKFWRAEEYHQKYLVKNPGGYTCHYLRD